MKVKGSDKAAISQRQQKVMQYWIRGVGPDSIANILKVDRKTIYRDVKVVEEQLSRRVEMAQLYTVQKAFAGLSEEWKEAWILFHRPKEKRTFKVGKELVTVEVDDSFRKLAALDRIHSVTELRCKLAGYFSPKVQERITMVETAAGRGLIIERLTYEEQMKLGVEELENNEGLARSEGLNPSD